MKNETTNLYSCGLSPMAIADSGASHVILPLTALHDGKSAKPSSLRLAAGEITAVEAHREIFAEHVTIPLFPLGRVIRKLQLTAIWTPKDNERVRITQRQLLRDTKPRTQKKGQGFFPTQLDCPRLEGLLGKLVTSLSRPYRFVGLGLACRCYASPLPLAKWT